MDSPSPEEFAERYVGQYDLTAALADHLRSRSLLVEWVAHDLVVKGRTVVPVSCRPLPSAQDRLWFWVENDAVCDAELTADAAMEIAALAARGPRRTRRLNGPGSGLNV